MEAGAECKCDDGSSHGRRARPGGSAAADVDGLVVVGENIVATARRPAGVGPTGGADSDHGNGWRDTEIVAPVRMGNGCQLVGGQRRHTGDDRRRAGTLAVGRCAGDIGPTGAGDTGAGRHRCAGTERRAGRVGAGIVVRLLALEGCRPAGLRRSDGTAGRRCRGGNGWRKLAAARNDGRAGRSIGRRRRERRVDRQAAGKIAAVRSVGRAGRHIIRERGDGRVGRQVIHSAAMLDHGGRRRTRCWHTERHAR